MTRQNAYKHTEFAQASPDLARCPADSLGEVAFAGRSNAGKSSAINTLTGNKKLARTSKTPGRTQLINYFAINQPEYSCQYLVDLPGYGYAKVPAKMKREWDKNLSHYLQQRQSLRGLILLMDSRHPLQEFDTMMLNWAVGIEMPVHILLTKADKLKKGPAKNTLLAVRKSLVDAGVDDLVTVQLFSSLKREGVTELVTVLDQWLLTSAEDTQAGEEV